MFNFFWTDEAEGQKRKGEKAEDTPTKRRSLGTDEAPIPPEATDATASAVENLALEKELEQKQASPDKTTGQETNDKQHTSGTSTSECSSEGESNSNSNPTGIIIEFGNTSKVCGDSIHLNQLTKARRWLLGLVTIYTCIYQVLFHFKYATIYWLIVAIYPSKGVCGKRTPNNLRQIFETGWQKFHLLENFIWSGFNHCPKKTVMYLC